MAEITEIRPQAGPQIEFQKSAADIVIFGGQAFGGKTFSLVIEPLRNIYVPGFSSLTFRRTFPEIMAPGGMWVESQSIYPRKPISGRARDQKADWRFPAGSSVGFSHLQYDSDLQGHHGDQICLLQFDQLETFTEKMFWFMLSRNRSSCGIRPYVRASCNPVPEDDAIGGWLNLLIAWWINQETGFAIPERSGVIRYFYRVDEKLVWADTAEELKAKYPQHATVNGVNNEPKSFTFINSTIWDNKIGLEKDPGYLSNLLSQPLVDRERLLKGNWKIRAQAGNIYRYEWLAPHIIDALPVTRRKVRCWDAAGTPETGSNDPAYTAGLKVSRENNKLFYVEDLIHFRGTELQVETTIKNTAKADGKDTTIVIFKDPGQAGKGQAERWVRELAGYNIVVIPAVKDTGKLMLAKPVSAQAEAGNIKILRAHWNKIFIDHLVAFPDGKYKDIPDAMGGAFKALVEYCTTWGTGEC